MKTDLLFLTLKVFSVTGGIEKVSRIAGKALVVAGLESGQRVQVFSAYDKDADLDPKYFAAEAFRGFAGARAAFVLESLKKGRGSAIVLLSHINLLPIGYAIKKLSPVTKLVLLAHGIEVWEPVPAWKKRMLRACDLILPVSRFTAEKMLSLYGLDRDKLKVVNNCLDPFLPPPSGLGKRPDLLQRYGLTADHKIILTLTRLSFKERYKGYDEVLMAVKTLKKTEPMLRYLIVGKADAEEKARLERLIRQQGLEAEVILAGFVPDEELAAHFELADLYAMPSRKEGFGIVFIEALYYGSPVIAGNVDGSVDALAGGDLGILVNPDYPDELLAGIQKMLGDKEAYGPEAAEVARLFSFPVYKAALLQALNTLLPKPQSPGKKKQQQILETT